LRFPPALDPARFLAGYWQKVPLFLPAAVDAAVPALSPDELAWLATLPDVESRLIHTDEVSGDRRYRVLHGPFDDRTLMQLPECNWTLLVQDVEKHLPDFRAYFAQVPFIPDWRMDDLMVSFAAPGGSVGPHLDQYDVLLCQGEGIRNWRLTSADRAAACTAHSELSLLQPFDAEQEFRARMTDVLYLPPGVPHWGVAEDRCMTYSIGMRAPQLSELVAAYRRLFPARQLADYSPQELTVFYQDPDLSPDEAVPGRISERALQRAMALFRPDGRPDADELAMTFGSLVTDPKAWLAPDRISTRSARRLLAGMRDRDTLPLHGMARIACVERGPGNKTVARLFANGFQHVLDSVFVDPVAELCRKRMLSCDDLDQWWNETRARELLEWLASCGAFDPGDE
jgi:50S ribosomal protein L16 3-hydroxylase